MTNPTPLPKLMQSLSHQFHNGESLEATWDRAFQAGADQELEACCVEVSFWGSKGMAEKLRAARRPKPPSLKEEALGGLDQLAVRLTEAGVAVDLDTIRRALESIDD